MRSSATSLNGDYQQGIISKGWTKLILCHPADLADCLQPSGMTCPKAYQS